MFRFKLKKMLKKVLVLVFISIALQNSLAKSVYNDGDDSKQYEKKYNSGYRNEKYRSKSYGKSRDQDSYEADELYIPYFDEKSENVQSYASKDDSYGSNAYPKSYGVAKTEYNDGSYASKSYKEDAPKKHRKSNGLDSYATKLVDNDESYGKSYGRDSDDYAGKPYAQDSYAAKSVDNDDAYGSYSKSYAVKSEYDEDSYAPRKHRKSHGLDSYDANSAYNYGDVYTNGKAYNKFGKFYAPVSKQYDAKQQYGNQYDSKYNKQNSLIAHYIQDSDSYGDDAYNKYQKYIYPPGFNSYHGSYKKYIQY